MTQVFLTGATGTIGSALVPRLLAQPGTQVCMLLRASDETDLQQRFEAMLAWWGLAPGHPDRARLQVLRGDISQPDFGLAAAPWQALADGVQRIVHCAASVKLNMPMAQAVATAVVPTRTILGLARRLHAGGRLQKLDLVSTVGVWGRSPGVMPERPLPEVRHFHNTYEAAKAEAERLVWTEGAGLPVTVHRPSMVVGDSRSGRVMHFQVFYHLCEFLSGCRTFGVMPELGRTRLDTVPVDWVADAIAWSSARTDTAGRILHLCSGPAQAVDLHRLQQLVRTRWRLAGQPVPTLRSVPRAWLQRLVPLLGLLAGSRGRRALRGLGPVLEYLAEDQGFDNTTSTALLGSAGLPLPPWHDYVGTVLDHYLQHRRAGVAA